MSQVADERLWAKIKHKWHVGDKGGVPGQWNARKAQLAVQEYKRLGGTYRTALTARRDRRAKIRWFDGPAKIGVTSTVKKAIATCLLKSVRN
jgi:hypothetical protein